LSQNGLASKSVERLTAMIERFRMPRSLSELGIQKKDIPRIAHLTTEIAPSLLKVNPRSPTEKDLSDILYTAFD